MCLSLVLRPDPLFFMVRQEAFLGDARLGCQSPEYRTYGILGIPQHYYGVMLCCGESLVLPV